MVKVDGTQGMLWFLKSPHFSTTPSAVIFFSDVTQICSKRERCKVRIYFWITKHLLIYSIRSCYSTDTRIHNSFPLQKEKCSDDSDETVAAIDMPRAKAEGGVCHLLLNTITALIMTDSASISIRIRSIATTPTPIVVARSKLEHVACMSLTEQGDEQVEKLFL